MKKKALTRKQSPNLWIQKNQKIERVFTRHRDGKIRMMDVFFQMEKDGFKSTGPNDCSWVSPEIYQMVWERKIK